MPIDLGSILVLTEAVVAAYTISTDIPISTDTSAASLTVPIPYVTHLIQDVSLRPDAWHTAGC